MLAARSYDTAGRRGHVASQIKGRRLPNLHRIQNVTIGLRASAVGSVLSESTERVKHKSREFSGVASSSPVKINSRVSEELPIVCSRGL